MFAFGTRVVLDDEPETVRLPAAVSPSPTVKARAPVLESSLIVWSAMSEIVGAVLLALRIGMNVRFVSFAVAKQKLVVVTGEIAFG